MKKQSSGEFVCLCFQNKYKETLLKLGYELETDFISRTIVVRLIPLSKASELFQQIRLLIEKPFQGFPVCVFLTIGNLHLRLP